VTVRQLFAFAFFLCLLVPSRASALLLGDNGFEPIFIEVKPSLRLSLDFDSHLQALAAIEAELGLTVMKRFAGPKYIELVAFPASFSREQARAAIVVLQQQTYVEKVVAASAFNLGFRSGDFARAYAPNETIPEAIRRGLDLDPDQVFDPLVVLQPHQPNHLIVKWRSELVWSAERTDFRQRMAELNASLGCRVVSESSFSSTELMQVLQFSGPDSSLASKIQGYLASGLVKYAQPNVIYAITTFSPLPRPRRAAQSVRENQSKRPLTGLRRLTH